MLFFEIFIATLFLYWLSGIIWLIHPYKTMTWFYHDILGWHKPIEEKTFNGSSACSRCRFCGKKIMMDSQGNWFQY